MLTTRVIPVLLLRNRGLCKGIRFRNHQYVGDPVNTIRIFNDKEVDELVVLDISASRAQTEPDFELLEELAGEAFMPMAYGGGLSRIDQIDTIFRLGYEKVVLNTAAVEDPRIVGVAAAKYGRQSIVVSIDAKRRAFGAYSVFTRSATKRVPSRSPIDLARAAAAEGAGEIIITSIDRDGTLSGYDTQLIHQVSQAVDVPVVASGGAATIDDLVAARDAGASAAAAGAMFVYQGPHRAVLIQYPLYSRLEQVLSS